MSREQQTKLIIAAIFGAVALYFAYDRITNPNLEGLHPYDRCQYWAYWHNHGGSIDKCQQIEAEAAAARLRGYDDDGLTPEQMNLANQMDAALNVAPAEVAPTVVPPAK